MNPVETLPAGVDWQDVRIRPFRILCVGHSGQVLDLSPIYPGHLVGHAIYYYMQFGSPRRVRVTPNEVAELN